MQCVGWGYIRLIATVALFLLSVQTVSAWGPEGHRIIAEIAQRHLQPEVANKIRADFNVKYLANVSDWADQVKDHRHQKSLHFTNYEKSARAYDQKRDCPDLACVTEVIPHYEKILKDRSATKKERLEALKYLIHFVGDVHQPLHLGNKKDKGGNNIQLNFGGSGTNLHALWDSGLILYYKKTSLVQYARMLDGKIREKDIWQWIQSGPVDWSNESRQLALDNAYAFAGGEVSMEYMQKSIETIDNQLCRAGIRLGHLLNQSLK